MQTQNHADAPTCPAGQAKPVAALRGHTGGVLALAFSPDRGLLASAARDGTARIWELSAAKPGERASVRQQGDPFNALAFSPSGRLLAAGPGLPGGPIRLYDVSDKDTREVAALRGGTGAVAALAFSPDGKLLAGGGEDRTVRVWDAGGSGGEARTLLPGHTGPITAAAFAPDGSAVATASRDGTVRVWALSRIRCWERACLPHRVEVLSVAYSPDGRTLATVCRGGRVRVWDVAGVKPSVRTELTGPPVGVRLVLVTADGDAAVVVGDGPRVVRWELKTGATAGTWEVPAEAPTAVAFTRDGRYLAAGSAAGAVGVYRVADKRS